MNSLDPIEIRVLGCLAEKELATPEYYPLTLNALVNACNQKTNRDPVVDYTEETVVEALDRLLPAGLITRSAGGGRVSKYCHNLDGKLKLDPAELAVLAELLLRGPQTPGELRQRAGRMATLETLPQVEAILDELRTRDQPLVVRLPRQPGRKEHRFAQLLGGDIVPVEAPPGTPFGCGSDPLPDQPRIAELERQIARLSSEVEELRRELQRFRQEFE